MKGKQLQNCLESFEYKLSTKSISNCNILFSGWFIHSMLQTAISKFAKLLTICSQTLSWFFAYILNLSSQCRAADLKIWIYMNVLTHSNKSTAHSFQSKTISCTQIGQNQRTYLDWTTSCVLFCFVLFDRIAIRSQKRPSVNSLGNVFKTIQSNNNKRTVQNFFSPVLILLSLIFWSLTLKTADNKYNALQIYLHIAGNWRLYYIIFTLHYVVKCKWNSFNKSNNWSDLKNELSEQCK